MQTGRRRGAWVRVRVNKKPKDVFETAESQNLASVSNNNLIKTATDGKGQQQSEREWTVPPNHRPTDPYATDEVQQTTVQNSGVIAFTSTEQPVTIKNDDDFKKSLTDMIREIIKGEPDDNDSEEQEIEIGDDKLIEKLSQSKKSKVDDISETNITTTSTLTSPFTTTTTTTISPEIITEVSATTIPTEESVAETILPEIATQSNFEDVTRINDEIVTLSNVVTKEPRVLGTSTTTEISLETEICYRGRCVKSKKNKKPLKTVFNQSQQNSQPSIESQSQSDLDSDLMSVE